MRFDGAGQVNAQLCPLGHELLLLYDEPPRCIEVTLLGLYEHVLDVLYALLERLELLGHRVEVVLERKRTGDLNAWLAEPSRRRRSTRAPPSLSAGGARTRAALQQERRTATTASDGSSEVGFACRPPAVHCVVHGARASGRNYRLSDTMPDRFEPGSGATAPLSRMIPAQEMRLFIRRLGQLCGLLVGLLALGTVGFVVTEDVSAWDGFVWTLDTIATVGAVP